MAVIKKGQFMITASILTNELVPLRTSDTGTYALSIMSDFFVRHLPVVNNEQLLALLSEEDILDHDAEAAVGSYPLRQPSILVQENDHIYEVMRLVAEHHLTVIPVVDVDSNYLGMITLEDLVQYFAKMGSFTEPGSIVVLEMHRRDYSLAELSRLVESENAAVLSSFVSSTLEGSLIDVTLKINRQNIQPILSTFERFNYEVKATFNERDYTDTLRERYDLLMNYLNV